MTSDPNADRLLSLLSVWQNRRAVGEEPSPEQLAPDEPNLWPALAQRIRAARELDPHVELSTTNDAAGDPTAADLPEPPPGYRLLRFLARGGMGAVYEATQEGLNRPVALKTLRAGERAAPAAVIRFLAEAEAVAAVRHRHVVQVYGFGDHGGRPFLAMEFCPGGDLAGRLTSQPMEAHDAAALLEKIARGVQAAHDRGIVHRDLKPGNVLFGEDGEPKIADFGLAKRPTSDDTADIAVMGTLAYMAPEQAEGKSKFVGPQADVWALGVILYEALTGRRPFTGATKEEVLANVLRAQPEPPRRGPRDLEQIILACLAKNPVDRYATAGALADDLRRFLDGKPVSVRAAGYLNRTVKWVKRNPVPTALILALAAIAGLIGGGAYVSNEQLRQLNAATGAQLTAEQGQREAERAKLLESHIARMRLGLQRGVGREVIAAYEEAVAAGLPVTEDMRLDKALAHEIISDTMATRREIGAIDRSKLPADRRGLADLVEGDLLIGVDDKRAEQLIDQALAQDLPIGMRLYGEGLRAKTTKEAIEKFEAAKERDPTNIPVRAMLGMTYFTLGRLQDVIALAEESRQFAPNHPHFTILLTLGHTFLGHREQAVASIKTMTAQFPDEPRYRLAREGLLAIVDFLAPFFEAERTGKPHNEFAAIGAMTKLLDIVPRALREFDRDKPEDSFRFPKYLRRGLLFLLSELVAFRDKPQNPAGPGPFAGSIFGMVATFFPAFKPEPSVFRFTTAADIAAARAKIETHPEGLLRTFFATNLYWFAEKQYHATQGDAASRALLAEAGAECARAWRTPGLIGKERTALMYGVLAYAYAVMPYGAAGPKPDEVKVWQERARHGADLAREFLHSTNSPNQSGQFFIMTYLAYQAQDYLLAREILDVWEKTFPPDSQHAAMRAYVDYKFGAYHSVIERMAKVGTGAGVPPSMLVELKLLRDEARRKIGLPDPETAPPPRTVRR